MSNQEGRNGKTPEGGKVGTLPFEHEALAAFRGPESKVAAV
jgi:hypothetical protein